MRTSGLLPFQLGGLGADAKRSGADREGTSKSETREERAPGGNKGEFQERNRGVREGSRTRPTGTPVAVYGKLAQSPAVVLIPPAVEDGTPARLRAGESGADQPSFVRTSLASRGVPKGLTVTNQPVHAPRTHGAPRARQGLGEMTTGGRLYGQETSKRIQMAEGVQRRGDQARCRKSSFQTGYSSATRHEPDKHRDRAERQGAKW